MQRIISVLVVLATPLLLAAGDDDVGKELKALQGKWKAEALEAGAANRPWEQCAKVKGDSNLTGTAFLLRAA